MYRKILTVLALSLMVVTAAQAQLTSSLNAFSPYTMYGIGSLSTGGNISSRGMGGIGVAVASPYEFNYVNAAALGSIAQKTAIFNFGLASSNYYQRSAMASTAYNSVDLYDVAFAVPLAKGIGFGVSLTPVSSVGYNTVVVDSNPSVVENIGQTLYSYYGDGGISQLQASLGAKVFGGLSLGVNMHYYFGAIDRTWKSSIFNYLNSATYRGVYSTESMNMSQIGFSFGLQYKVRVGDDDNLSIGATYQPRFKGDMNRSQYTTTMSTNITDTVSMNNSVFRINMPEKIAGGIYFGNTKMGVGFDYSRQDWRGAYDAPAPVALCLLEDYRFGAEYTPDRFSVRSFMSRITYKVGARYSNSYLSLDDNQLNEWAVSAGLEVPLKMRNFSNFNLALEYGIRDGQTARVKENFFKVLFGISIFAGDDMWFVQRKFN